MKLTDEEEHLVLEYEAKQSTDPNYNRYKSAWYIIDDDGTPLRARNVMEQAFWQAKMQAAGIDHKTVAKTGTPAGSVSTVFLELDHNFSNEGPPVLWETLVFGGPHDGRMERYTSRAAAEEGHKQMVEFILCPKNLK